MPVRAPSASELAELPSSATDATERHWDFSGPVPLPKGDWLVCPICRAGDAIPRTFLFHEAQPEASLPYRCDAAFKCRECALIINFGIVVSEADWERFVPYGETSRLIQRPETRRLLSEYLAAAGG